MLQGTPAIGTDWGAYTETIIPGVTGFRFRTLSEGVEAVARAGDLSPAVVRGRTTARYSLDAVAPLFWEWFERIDSLWRDGWYEMAAPAAMIPE